MSNPKTKEEIWGFECRVITRSVADRVANGEAHLTVLLELLRESYMNIRRRGHNICPIKTKKDKFWLLNQYVSEIASVEQMIEGLGNERLT